MNSKPDTVAGLLTNARSTYKSIVATVVSWLKATDIAAAVGPRQTEEAPLISVEPQPHDSAAREIQQCKVWLDAGGARRYEIVDYTGAHYVTIVHDHKWVHYSAADEAPRTSQRDSHAHQIGTPYEEMFDPGPMVPYLKFEKVSPGVFLGRDVFYVEARPVGETAWNLFHAATEYRLAVDAERGILLRIHGVRNESVFARWEITEVEFDISIPEELLLIPQ